MKLNTVLLGLLFLETIFATRGAHGFGWEAEEGLDSALLPQPIDSSQASRCPTRSRLACLAALLAGGGATTYALTNTPWRVDEQAFHAVGLNQSDMLELWTEGRDHGMGQCMSNSYETFCAGEGSDYAYNAPRCRSHPYNPCRHDRGAHCHCHVTSYTSKHNYPKDSECHCKCRYPQVRRYNDDGDIECVDPPRQGDCEKTSDVGTFSSCGSDSQCQIDSSGHHASWTDSERSDVCVCQKGTFYNECRYQGLHGNGCDEDANCDTARGFTCQQAPRYVDPVYECMQ